MIKANNQVGSINILLIPLIISSVLFFVVLGFSVWSYMGMVDYKNNSDQKASKAVSIAVEENSTKKDNEFLEKEKSPYRNYKSSEILGSISFNYPKTWSGYYKSTDRDMSLVMQKGVVTVSNDQSPSPIKVEVINSTYNSNTQELEANVKSGKLKASAFRLAKLPSILGVKFEGELLAGKKGVVVMLPMREKTIKVTAQVDEYVSDLNNIILPSFTFTP